MKNKQSFIVDCAVSVVVVFVFVFAFSTIKQMVSIHAEIKRKENFRIFNNMISSSRYNLLLYDGTVISVPMVTDVQIVTNEVSTNTEWFELPRVDKFILKSN